MQIKKPENQFALWPVWLRRYADTTVFFSFLPTRNNFVQVDVFYQELSNEVIEQNIAFEFLSLLSEVGGFLGLLLGASVLTVCELVDYVSLKFIKKLRLHNRVDIKH